MDIGKRSVMSKMLNTNKPIVPPAFMATTRQKIILGEHTLPHSMFEIEHPRTMHAIQAIGNFTKEVVNFAKQL